MSALTRQASSADYRRLRLRGKEDLCATVIMLRPLLIAEHKIFIFKE